MELGRRKILIVDDNLELAKTLDRFLRIQGFETSIASNGREAIGRALSEPPELILLDIKLPDMSGMEVLNRLRESGHNSSIIVITGYGGERVAIDFMKAGAFDFLSKPIDHGVLLKKIQKAFQARNDHLRTQLYPTPEEFFPFLAHKVRNPLHAIGGALALVQKHSDPTDHLLAQSTIIIQKEVRHLEEFVQECLDFVRSPAKGYFAPTDIKEVIRAALDIASHMFQAVSSGVKITLEAEPNLPKIEANYEELKRALLNLLKNSFEAMPEGGQLAIRAGFRPEPSPGQIEIAIADTGTGVRREDMKALFTPFFTTKPRGTGLGLPICHRIIVERHKGKMQIKSQEGKGTTVFIKLPASHGHPLPRPRKNASS